MFDHIDLFSGIGGMALGLKWAGFKTIQFVEIDKFCQKVLRKNFPGVPIHDDIKTFHYGEQCEAINNEKLIQTISNVRKKQNLQRELFANANIAEHQGQCRQASPTGDGGSVLTNVGIHSNEERMGQTQVVGHGCEEKIIPTTKMGMDMTVTKGTGKTRCGNGEEGSMQETTLLAKNAASYPEQQTHSMPTTLSPGEIFQKKDSMLITELLSVKNATPRSINNEQVFLLTAGVPCQPASCAGKRRGHNDDRWLWEEAFRVVAECKPKWVILENVAGILTLEQGLVFDYLLSQLESQGYETEAFIIPACAVQAPHRRDRVWIVAHSESERNRGCSSNQCGEYKRFMEQNQPTRGKVGCQNQGCSCESADVHAADTTSERLQRSIQTNGSERQKHYDKLLYGCNREWDEPWLEVATRLCRVDDGLPRRVDRVNRLKALGNAVVPQIVEILGTAILETERFSYLRRN